MSAKLEYIEEQPLDLTELEMTASFKNGKRSILDIKEDQVNEFDSRVPVNGQIIFGGGDAAVNEVVRNKLKELIE